MTGRRVGPPGCLLPRVAGHRTRGVPRGSVAERGSASIWLLGVGLALVLLAGAASGVGSAAVARHRAQTAADLAALGAAALLPGGSASACRLAGQLVVANGGRLAGCTVDGVEVRVDVVVTPAGPAGRWGPARADARAGPGGGAAPGEQ